MTNFIFCLIFIQVSVFLITGITLLTSLFIGFRQNHKALATSGARYGANSSANPLTRTELEYFMAEDTL